MKPGYTALFLFMTILSVGIRAAGEIEDQRARMVEEVTEMVRQTESYTGKDKLDPRVMQAMGKVPRHEFVPDAIRSHAYVNSALPIGFEQTISQPYIVALMTDLAEVGTEDQVLEIGTGSGYQAAILAELARHVYTIEIVEDLGLQARETLDKLGYDNISTRIGNGYHGWSAHAPYDAILVTAAIDEIPVALLEQLAPGGKMVIPLGPQDQTQSLTIVEKNADGTNVQNAILPVGFVPLTGTNK